MLFTCINDSSIALDDIKGQVLVMKSNHVIVEKDMSYTTFDPENKIISFISINLEVSSIDTAVCETGSV